MTGASDKSDRAVVNGAASVSAVPASVPSAREAALVAAVRDVLSCLGQPTGYFPSIGAPLTHSLQRAFEAYEPHPAHKRHY